MSAHSDPKSSDRASDRAALLRALIGPAKGPRLPGTPNRDGGGKWGVAALGPDKLPSTLSVSATSATEIGRGVAAMEPAPPRSPVPLRMISGGARWSSPRTSESLASGSDSECLWLPIRLPIALLDWPGFQWLLKDSTLFRRLKAGMLVLTRGLSATFLGEQSRPSWDTFLPLDAKEWFDPCDENGSSEASLHAVETESRSAGAWSASLSTCPSTSPRSSVIAKSWKLTTPSPSASKY
mmetsp:Transcript_59879/g.182981  ORF Transcript_59879/g.182981 Transcript_59879/m.182981 type:complete len:238 (+) Transcript_59879:323-1036(+)